MGWASERKRGLVGNSSSRIRATSGHHQVNTGDDPVVPAGLPSTTQRYDHEVELHDDQPTQHEIGKRTYLIAPVEPLDVDGVRTVQVGTAVFLLAFIALLPFYGRLQEEDQTWLLWMCLTGVGLGVLGIEYCKHRRQLRSDGSDQPGSDD